jgi:hypothetical protein
MGASWPGRLEVPVGAVRCWWMESAADRLIAETELALKATAASEDFDACMESIKQDAGATPEEMAATR